jgi:hypothetical protein
VLLDIFFIVAIADISVQMELIPIQQLHNAFLVIQVVAIASVKLLIIAQLVQQIIIYIILLVVQPVRTIFNLTNGMSALSECKHLLCY